MGKLPNGIVKFSGGEWWYKEVKSTGADLDAADTWHDLGYIAENEFNDNKNFDKKYDESGAFVKRTQGNREVTIKCVHMQSDKATLDLLGKSEDKFYAIYHYEGVVDSKHQEFWFGICQITSPIQLKSGTKNPPFDIDVLVNRNALTIAANALPTPAKVGAQVSIAADEYYTITETAVV